MEPLIQYAKTKDGVSIAYWTLGEGMPLVIMPVLFASIQAEWQFPDFRRWYERLAASRKLVRYDRRGTGLSERDVTDFSLDSHLQDLQAVTDQLGLDRFALFAGFHSGLVAITYATRRPERLTHLVLWCSYARGLDISESPQVRAWSALIDKDWEFFSESVAQFLGGWSTGKEARRYAAYIRESITPEALQGSLAEITQFDVSALLPDVSSPTLILHRRHVPYPKVEVARALASRIPDARLALLEGESLSWSGGDTEPVLTAIEEFLGEGEEAAAGVLPLGPSAFRTVLFTDVEGSTALTQRLGDARARELLREHERIVREALRAHGGSEVKTMGDGFMASFSAATRALECAIAMQRAFAEWNEGAEEPIRVRVGLNAGEPIAEEDPDGRSDLFGTAVNLAARIAAKAKGAEILVSDVVRQLVAGKDFLFADRGEANLKGFDEPVRLYEVRWREEG
jgi:class 3 adenylate cyclase